MRPGRVALGWVRPTLVHGAFMESVLDAVADPRIGGWQGVLASANVSHGRNELVRWLLHQPGYEWLLMVDTDMVFTASDVGRLLGAADRDQAPVVGGLCFAQGLKSGAVWPTLYEVEMAGGERLFVRRGDWPSNTLMPVGGTGAAFLIVHRAVFEQIRDAQFSAAFPWFQETENSLGRVSEDLTFCDRVGRCGYPIYVHTGVQVGHVKERTVGVGEYSAQHRTPQVGGVPGGQG